MTVDSACAACAPAETREQTLEARRRFRRNYGETCRTISHHEQVSTSTVPCIAQCMAWSLVASANEFSPPKCEIGNSGQPPAPKGHRMHCRFRMQSTNRGHTRQSNRWSSRLATTASPFRYHLLPKKPLSSRKPSFVASIWKYVFVFYVEGNCVRQEEHLHAFNNVPLELVLLIRPALGKLSAGGLTQCLAPSRLIVP